MSPHSSDTGRVRPALRAAERSRRVAYATVTAGDQVIVNGQRRRVAAVIQTRAGFVLQFPDAAALHIVGPPEVCEIDGRQVRLDDIATDECFWCGTARRLLAVGRYMAPSGHTRTVYACTGCTTARGLLPLASRTGNDTQVRYGQRRTR